MIQPENSRWEHAASLIVAAFEDGQSPEEAADAVKGFTPHEVSLAYDVVTDPLDQSIDPEREGETWLPAMLAAHEALGGVTFVLQRRYVGPSTPWIDNGTSPEPPYKGQDEESFTYLEGDYLYEAFRTIARAADGTEFVLAVSSRGKDL